MPNANRNKGLQAERDVARYCREHGMPGAERSVATGFASGPTRVRADEGDIKGIPGVCIQVKYLAKPLTGKNLADALRETQEQADAAGAALPLLLERRHGHGSPGDWWVHMSDVMFGALMFGLDPASVPSHGPVRVEFRQIVHQVARFSAWVSREGGAVA